MNKRLLLVPLALAPACMIAVKLGACPLHRAPSESASADERLPAYYRLFYRARRPTGWGKRLNAAWARVYALGALPSFLVALETTGRRSGRGYRNALVAADYDGQRYLVSMLGENVDWVRNVREAGGDAAIRYRGRRSVRLVEVPVEERAPIIKAYISRARGARPHIAVDHDAPLAEFEKIAPRHPVFRIEPQP